MPRKKQTNETTVKSKGLFDHINQIRNTKNPNYFDTLTDAEKKSFNHYMICRFLSMDPNVIDEVCYLSKIFDKMDSKSFYKVCCEVIKPVKFTPYIKSKNKKFNKLVLELISNKYQVSKSDANDYCEIMSKTDTGLNHLYEDCRAYGLEEKQIEKILNKDEE